MAHAAPLLRALTCIGSAFLLASSNVAANPFGSDNVLVALGQPTAGNFAPPFNQVVEYTVSGQLKQTIQFQYAGTVNPPGEYIEDLEVDSDGLLEVVNGYNNPLLTRYSPITGSFTDTAIPGLTLLGTQGKLATYQNFTFIPDNTSEGHNPPPPGGGVLQLDRSTGVITRLNGHYGVEDIAMGLDGKLYALYQPSPGGGAASSIDVYNPVTGVWLYNIVIPPDTINGGISAIAVDTTGQIFAVGAWYLYRISPAGAIEQTLMPVPMFEILGDINVDENGRLIMVSNKANVLIGTTALAGFTTFSADNNPDVYDWAAFISFARHIPAPAPPPIVASGAERLANISTRLQVNTGDQVGIAGFIITGGSAQVVLRAIGPTLTSYGIDAALADPTLELHDDTGAILATNDNWQDTQASEIETLGLAPFNPSESAIVRTLAPGSYTAIIQGKDGGTGVGLVEAYDVSTDAGVKFGDISTRGFVDKDQNVMIGGFIASGQPSAGDAVEVVVRGLGPSLAASGVTGTLQDPALDLYNANGDIIASNDNWKTTQQSELEAVGLAPGDDREAALLTSLLAGPYTVVLRGKGTATGNGLIEAYSIR